VSHALDGKGVADDLITFDQFIAKDDFVVERYTASGRSGTARRFETHQPYGHLDRHKYIPHCLRISKSGQRLTPTAAGGS
jgi:hypothetical protein